MKDTRGPARMCPTKGVFEMSERKVYDREFRLGAARMVVDQGFSQREVAKRLGVTAAAVSKWIKDFRARGVLPPVEKSAPQADELRALRKENQRMQMENEILKKAAAYFAKESQ